MWAPFVFAYLVGYAVMWRFTFRFFLDDLGSYSSVDWEDVVVAGLMGSLCNVLWPFILFWRLFTKRVTAEGFARRVGGWGKDDD